MFSALNFVRRSKLQLWRKNVALLLEDKRNIYIFKSEIMTVFLMITNTQMIDIFTCTTVLKNLIILNVAMQYSVFSAAMAIAKQINTALTRTQERRLGWLQLEDWHSCTSCSSPWQCLVVWSATSALHSSLHRLHCEQVQSDIRLCDACSLIQRKGSY
jgi:hypothetical protein